jgi:hypothetical protein
MVKLSQKQRRERRKMKNESTNNINCSICLEEINDDKLVILKCKHKFHKTCLNEWNLSQLKNSEIHIVAPLTDLKKDVNAKMNMLVHLDGGGVVSCPCCRVEYTILEESDEEGYVKQKKILGKVRFSEIEDTAFQFYGKRPVHYITDYSDLLYYTPKTINTARKMKEWMDAISLLIEGMKRGTCTDLDVVKCNCTDINCPRIYLFNEEILKYIYDNNVNRLKFMDVCEFRHYVSDKETFKEQVKLL